MIDVQKGCNVWQVHMSSTPPFYEDFDAMNQEERIPNVV
jgi:hypothetical protein